jgi:hypothetical protein
MTKTKAVARISFLTLASTSMPSEKTLVQSVIGPQTKRALVRFQKDNGLEQTATLDTLTLKAEPLGSGLLQESLRLSAGFLE